jgi:TrmH family RNA methyltransferase
MSTPVISTRNARFQQWQALLGNRTKRHRAGAFVVQGVRPISLAATNGWTFEMLLHPADRPLSSWARELLAGADAPRMAMTAELLRELGDKEADTPELIAVVRTPPDDLTRIPVPADFLGVVFDRPVGPGNVGTLIRSADALGAHGLVVTGHAADVYDPKAVRASTGSLFGLPVVRAGSHREVLDWIGDRARIVGTDEVGTVDLAAADLTGPTLLVIGNETAGMSVAWRESCDEVARIPIVGSASSLNAANAGSIVLYEAARQRNR